MKRYKIGLFLILNIAIVANAQKRTVVEYYPAYVQNAESLKIIGRENVMQIKDRTVQEFLLDYPVLEKIEDFDPKEKYSMINIHLCKSIPYDVKGKYFQYDLINGKSYRIKYKNLVEPPF